MIGGESKEAGEGKLCVPRCRLLEPFPTTNLYVIFCDSQVPGLSGFLRRHDSLTFPLLIGRELRL